MGPRGSSGIRKRELGVQTSKVMDMHVPNYDLGVPFYSFSLAPGSAPEG